MSTSILNTVKPYCNVDPTDTDFDVELKIHINATIATLRQFKVGPESFVVTGTTETWDDFVTDALLGSLVQGYVCNEVAMKFDKSASGTVVQAMQEQSKQLLFQIQLEVDHA